MEEAKNELKSDASAVVIIQNSLQIIDWYGLGVFIKSESNPGNFYLYRNATMLLPLKFMPTKS